MTIATTLNRQPYTGNGVIVTFAYPFEIFLATDLQVYVDGVLKILTTDYTVSGAGAPTGGNVVFNVAPANLSTIIILRVEPQTQTSAFPSNDKFPTTVVETALDKLTMLVQQLTEVDARSLKLAVTSLFANLTVPDPVTGKFLRWKDATQLENVDITAAGSIGIPVSTANGGTGVNAASAAALAKALGLGLWGGSTGGSASLSIAAGVGTLPDPLTTNIFTVASALSSLTPNPLVGTLLTFYWNAASVVATDSASLQLLGRRTHTFTTGDVSILLYIGGAQWIEVKRTPIASTADAGKFRRGDGVWAAASTGGCTLSNSGGDAVNDIVIAPGARWSDDADYSQRSYMNLVSPLTKQIDANWAVGTNVGGLDTGAVGNGTYHMWLILRPDTGVVDVLFSLSASAPTMPANYTKKWRIGSVLREGGSLVAFIQNYDLFLRVTSSLDVDNATPGTSANTGTLKVPTGIQVQARFNVLQTNGQAAVYVSSLSVTDETPSGTVAPLATTSNAANTSAVQADVLTNTSAQVRYRATANLGVKIATLGWVDRASQGA